MQQLIFDFLRQSKNNYKIILKWPVWLEKITEIHSLLKPAIRVFPF